MTLTGRHASVDVKDGDEIVLAFGQVHAFLFNLVIFSVFWGSSFRSCFNSCFVPLHYITIKAERKGTTPFLHSFGAVFFA